MKDEMKKTTPMTIPENLSPSAKELETPKKEVDQLLYYLLNRWNQILDEMKAGKNVLDKLRLFQESIADFQKTPEDIGIPGELIRSLINDEIRKFELPLPTEDKVKLRANITEANCLWQLIRKKSIEGGVDRVFLLIGRIKSLKIDLLFDVGITKMMIKNEVEKAVFMRWLLILIMTYIAILRDEYSLAISYIIYLLK